MDKKLKALIEKTEIPTILKDYFLRSNHAHLYLNESLLNEIEESYIEYDSLYEFDDAEFCSYVIVGIKKQDKHDYFYYYLKKVLDSNLKLISKSPTSDYEKLSKLEKNLIPEDEILIILNNLLITIQDFKSKKELPRLLRAYRLVGGLEILFTLYPDSEFKEDFEKIYTTLLDASF